jgi:Flp pilus assembly protein TadD
LRPTANAIAALHYASDLAPQDLGVRMNSAIAYLNEGKPTDARATLVPVAYSPHGGTASEMARRMLADIDGGNPKAALLELRHSPAPASAGH